MAGLRSLLRRRSAAQAEPDAPDAPVAPARSPAWPGLPAMPSPVIDAMGAPASARAREFVRDLPTRWHQPAAVQALGHDVRPEVSAGLLTDLAVPASGVTARNGSAADLRWLSVAAADRPRPSTPVSVGPAISLSAAPVMDAAPAAPPMTAASDGHAVTVAAFSPAQASVSRAPARPDLERFPGTAPAAASTAPLVGSAPIGHRLDARAAAAEVLAATTRVSPAPVAEAPLPAPGPASALPSPTPASPSSPVSAGTPASEDGPEPTASSRTEGSAGRPGAPPQPPIAVPAGQSPLPAEALALTAVPGPSPAYPLPTKPLVSAKTSSRRRTVVGPPMRADAGTPVPAPASPTAALPAPALPTAALPTAASPTAALPAPPIGTRSIWTPPVDLPRDETAGPPSNGDQPQPWAKDPVAVDRPPPPAELATHAEGPAPETEPAPNPLSAAQAQRRPPTRPLVAHSAQLPAQQRVAAARTHQTIAQAGPTTAYPPSPAPGRPPAYRQPAARGPAAPTPRPEMPTDTAAPPAPPPVGHSPVAAATRAVQSFASPFLAARAAQPVTVDEQRDPTDDPAHLDHLAAQLYGRLRSHLSTDLLVGRERATMLTDL